MANRYYPYSIASRLWRHLDVASGHPVTHSIEWIEMWYPSLVSLLHWNDRRLVISLKCHCGYSFMTSHRLRFNEVTLYFPCEPHLKTELCGHQECCIFMSHQIMPQCSHMLYLRLATFRISTPKSLSVLLCEKSLQDFISLLLKNLPQNK